MKKNTASQSIGAQMITASDGSAFTGSVTVYVTGDNGTQAVGSVGSGACTHEGNGYHSYAPAQAETNYDHIAFTFIGTGAIPVTVQLFTMFPQTGDSYSRLGAPAGASVSADIATIDGNVDSILVDTGTTLETHLTDIKGGTFSGATDSLEAIRDRGDAAWITGAGGTPPQLLQSTTIATLASQTSFTLTAGSADDDAYNNALAIITDQSTSTQKAVACISDYVGSTKTITLLNDPAIFTMAVGDTIDIIVGINQKFPGNFQDLQVSIGTGRVTVGTNQDKTGYEIAGTNTRLDDLNDIAATDIVSNGAITTLSGAVVNVDTVDTCTTNTDMVSSPPTAASIADAVWDEAITGHLTAGSTGNALNAAGSAGDPWSTPLPGAYGSGTAGKIIGDIITDTNELQTDWTNGGRLDLIIDAILTDTNEVQTDLANGGRIDLLVDGIKAVTDVIPDSGAMTSIATAAALTTVDTVVDGIKAKTDSLTFTDSGKVDATLQAAVDIKAAVANKVADHTLRRSLATALSSSDGDTKGFRSLAGSIAKQVNKVELSGSTLTIYETDDSTSLGTQTATTSSSASPVTSLDTD